MKLKERDNAGCMELAHNGLHDFEVGLVNLAALGLHPGPHHAEADHIQTPAAQHGDVGVRKRELWVEGVRGGMPWGRFHHHVQPMEYPLPAPHVHDHAAAAIHMVLRNPLHSP